MKFVAVASSNVEAVAYDNDKLYVRFSGGGVYRYHGVPPERHAALMAAPSKGAYVAQHIKHKFPTDKLTAAEVAALSGGPAADAPAVAP